MKDYVSSVTGLLAATVYFLCHTNLNTWSFTVNESDVHLAHLITFLFTLKYACHLPHVSKKSHPDEKKNRTEVFKIKVLQKTSWLSFHGVCLYCKL